MDLDITSQRARTFCSWTYSKLVTIHLKIFKRAITTTSKFWLWQSFLSRKDLPGPLNVILIRVILTKMLTAVISGQWYFSILLSVVWTFCSKHNFYHESRKPMYIPFGKYKRCLSFHLVGLLPKPTEVFLSFFLLFLKKHTRNAHSF